MEKGKESKYDLETKVEGLLGEAFKCYVKIRRMERHKHIDRWLSDVAKQEDGESFDDMTTDFYDFIGEYCDLESEGVLYDEAVRLGNELSGKSNEE